MRLNIYNNFRAIYYNTLANFYLCFNSIVPYYDDVILSLSITSFKNVLNNNNLCLRTIKQNRLVQLLYSLNDKDNLILDDDGFIIIDYKDKDNDVVYAENAEFSDNTENDVDNADAVENTEEVVENTEEVVENTDEIVENTDEIVENTDVIVENTEEVVENTEEVVENTEEVVENTEEVVENTEEGDKEVKFNILDKKNN